MRKTLTLSIVVLGALLSIAAIKFYTDYPNSVPIGSDFFSLQRNQSYINASVSQVKSDWFNNPVFTGSGGIQGNWRVDSFVSIGRDLSIGGIYYGNGAGLTNVPGISGNFFAATNGIGQNPTFYGGGSFFGTYYFDEVDALNFYPTNFYTGLTNFSELGTDGNGKLTGGVWTNNSSFIWPAGEPGPDTTGTLLGPGFFLRNDGSFFVGTNVTAENDFSQFSTMWFPVILSQTLSNQAPEIQGEIKVTDSRPLGTFTSLFDYDIFGDPANGYVQWDFQSKSTSSNPDRITFNVDQNGALGKTSLLIKTNGVQVFLADHNGTVTANKFNGNGITVTNLGYGLPTNNVGGAAFVFGGPGTAATLYDTNITAATTLKLFDITACGATAGGIKLYVTCSGGTDRILTFPNGCSGAGLGTPPAVTITNAKAAFFDVIYKPGATPVTNVFWSPVY